MQIIRSLCITLIVAVILFVIVKLETPEETTEEIPSSSLPNVLYSSKNALGQALTISGTLEEYSPLNLEQFSPSISPSVSELFIKNVLIDPGTFTDVLKNFTNLRKLSLKHVKIGLDKPWNFNRVYLPKLEEFSLHLDIGFRDQYTDYMKDVSEASLWKLLFYDKTTPVNNYPTIGKKLAGEGVSISLKLDGWSVLTLEKTKNDTKNTSDCELVMGLSFTDYILEDFNKLGVGIKSLTMTECSISQKNIPKGLKYLNLYRVNITDGDITSYLKSLGGKSTLEELYIEIRNATLNLSDIPKSVKNLAIGDVINANYKMGDKTTVQAETIGLGFPLDEEIIKNFHSIFVKVKKIGVFEPTDQHNLLKNIMMTNATWVLLEGFGRPGNNALNLTDVEMEVEKMLKQWKVPENERNFLLFKDENEKTGNWSQSVLTKEQKLQYRYDFLGWDKYIQWETFSTNLDF